MRGDQEFRRPVVIMALSTPGIAGRRVEASPFGAVSQNEWSLPAMGLAGIASAFLEPDPEIQWNDDRLASVRRALRAWAPPAA